ncbi:MAG: peroxiredoxin-like family protein [Xanthomonadales bacterium]
MTRLLITLSLFFLAAFPGQLSAQDARSAIHQQAEQVQPLLPGMMAPAFTVRDVESNAVVFDPAKLEKPLILTFFRGGWCPYCNLHLAELRLAEKELKELGFDIWFISVDKPELLYESLEQPDIAYTIFSDAKLEATRAFGLAFRVDDDIYDRILSYGINLEEASGETHHVLPAPSTYIIGTNGIINFQFTNPDYKVRLHPDVLLAAARAYVNEADQRLDRARKARMKE